MSRFITSPSSPRTSLPMAGHNNKHIPITIIDNPSICKECRGGRYLCGLAYCPIIVVSATVSALLDGRVDRSIDGYTPPSVFIGRAGYPRISIGPMIPVLDDDKKKDGADTGIYDCPEQWHGMALEDILRFRLALVRGKVRVHVEDAEPSRCKGLASKIQELAMARAQVDAEMILRKRPIGFTLSEYLPPSGPSAEMEMLNVGSVRVDERIERAYHDDISAEMAILQLYTSGVSISGIVRALSAGCLGYRRRRRFVPTRWSITAVDDTVSRAIIEQVRYWPSVDEFIVYSMEVSMNRFVCMLAPGAWEYEWIEAWFPGTTWNAYGSRCEMIGDHEGYTGRKEYARVGGCYYSARLAVAEHLASLRRQARVLMLREIYPGFNVPVGVWFVRENVRAMLRGKGERFSSIDDAVSYMMSMLRIPLSEWVRESHMLRDMRMHQTRLSDYI